MLEPVTDTTPYGRCPICQLPIVPSRIEKEAVCDSGHRFRYQDFDLSDDLDEPTFHIGTYVGKDD